MTKDKIKVLIIDDDCSAFGRNIVRRLAAMDCGDVIIIERPIESPSSEAIDRIVIGSGVQKPINIDELIQNRVHLKPKSILGYYESPCDRGGKPKKGGNHRYPIRTKLHGFHNKGRTCRI